jgi:hypothetical protein
MGRDLARDFRVVSLSETQIASDAQKFDPAALNLALDLIAQLAANRPKSLETPADSDHCERTSSTTSRSEFPNGTGTKRKAVDSGFDDFPRLRFDPDFAALRDVRAFLELTK